jgi:hypothetical protein
MDKRSGLITQRKIVQRMFGVPSPDPIPDRLEYYGASRETTCAMVLMIGATGAVVAEKNFKSGGGLHAEEKVIEWLQYQVNTGVLHPQPWPEVKDYILYLSVSKSPCSSTSNPPTRTDGNFGCLEKLMAVNTYGLRHPGYTVTFDVQIAPTKSYQPSIRGAKAASIAGCADFGGANAGDDCFGFVRL